MASLVLVSNSFLAPCSLINSTILTTSPFSLQVSKRSLRHHPNHTYSPYPREYEAHLHAHPIRRCSIAISLLRLDLEIALIWSVMILVILSDAVSFGWVRGI